MVDSDTARHDDNSRFTKQTIFCFRGANERIFNFIDRVAWEEYARVNAAAAAASRPFEGTEQIEILKCLDVNVPITIRTTYTHTHSTMSTRNGSGCAICLLVLVSEYPSRTTTATKFKYMSMRCLKIEQANTNCPTWKSSSAADAAALYLVHTEMNAVELLLLLLCNASTIPVNNVFRWNSPD